MTQFVTVPEEKYTVTSGRDEVRHRGGVPKIMFTVGRGWTAVATDEDEDLDCLHVPGRYIVNEFFKYVLNVNFLRYIYIFR